MKISMSCVTEFMNGPFVEVETARSWSPHESIYSSHSQLLKQYKRYIHGPYTASKIIQAGHVFVVHGEHPNRKATGRNAALLFF